MRIFLFGLILLSAACEDTAAPPSSPSGATKPAASAPAAQPTKPLPPAQTQAPVPVASPVRPPSKDDLATYLANIPGTGTPKATIKTSMGTFECELFADKTPITVANFIGLATGQKPWKDAKSGTVMEKKPYYDGLTFHRVIPEFMLQGGCPLGTGTGGPGYVFDDEIASGVVHEAGSLSMANAGIREGHGTNGSQFFITEVATTFLNGKHTVFGRCKDVDLVKKIARTARDENDKPIRPVVIESVTITR